LGAGLLEEVLQREGVHDGAEHAHVVGASAVHAALAELRPAEEVAAADDDRHFDAVGVVLAARRRLRDLARDGAHHIGVHAEGSRTECLSRELEQDATALRHGGPFGGWFGGGGRLRWYPVAPRAGPTGTPTLPCCGFGAVWPARPAHCAETAT